MGTAPCPVPALGELVGHAVDEGLSYLYSVGNTGRCSTNGPESCIGLTIITGLQGDSSSDWSGDMSEFQIRGPSYFISE